MESRRSGVRAEATATADSLSVWVLEHLFGLVLDRDETPM